MYVYTQCSYYGTITTETNDTTLAPLLVVEYWAFWHDWCGAGHLHRRCDMPPDRAQSRDSSSRTSSGLQRQAQETLQTLQQATQPHMLGRGATGLANLAAEATAQLAEVSRETSGKTSQQAGRLPSNDRAARAASAPKERPKLAAAAPSVPTRPRKAWAASNSAEPPVPLSQEQLEAMDEDVRATYHHVVFAPSPSRAMRTPCTLLACLLPRSHLLSLTQPCPRGWFVRLGPCHAHGRS